MEDDATHFSTARFLEDHSSLWAAVCTGLPNIFVFDNSSHFRDTFVEICEIHDVEWQMSGTQRHSALGIGERCYKPIKRKFQKLRIDHLVLKKEFLISLAVKTCNDTLEHEELEP